MLQFGIKSKTARLSQIISHKPALLRVNNALPGRFALILMGMLVMISPAARAQDAESLVVITAENAARLQPIARYGLGVPRATVMDGDRYVVATAIGVFWFADDPQTSDAPPIGGQVIDEGIFTLIAVPDTPYIVTGGVNGRVRVWEDMQPVYELEEHLYPIRALAASLDGRLVASADSSGVVRVFEVGIWEEPRVFQTGAGAFALAFSDDGTRLAVGSPDSYSIWALDDPPALLETIVSLQNIYTLRFINDGFMVDQPENRTPCGVNPRSRLVCIPFNVRFSADHLLAEYATQPSLLAWPLRVFDTAAEPPPATISYSLLLQGTGAPSEIAVSPDGRWIAARTGGGEVNLIDSLTGETWATLYGQRRRVTAFAFSPDSGLLAAGNFDGVIAVWDITAIADAAPDARDRDALVALSGHASEITALAFDQSGTRLASTSTDGTAIVWAIAPG